MLAVLAPGQGAQKPGMLLPWLELPGVGDRLEDWSAASGLDLIELGCRADAGQIRGTDVAQPLLTALALLSAAALLGEDRPDVVCGHSVGELSALALSGVLSERAAVSLAAVRGRLMAAATAERPTGMAALMGAGAEEVAASCAERGLAVATVNVAGQVVLGGPLGALQELAAAPPHGVRVRLLDVAGAFHTAAMASAVDGFAAAVREVPAGSAAVPIVANADGAVLHQGTEALERLIAQLTGPVRFDRCLATLAGLGVDAVIELAPAGALGPMVRRALPDAELVALQTPEDLTAARALLSGHAAPETPNVSWRVVTSPVSGTLGAVLDRGAVRAGQQLTVVTSGARTTAVAAPVDGLLDQWLVSPGDPVRADQALAVLA